MSVFEELTSISQASVIALAINYKGLVAGVPYLANIPKLFGN